MTSRNEYAAVIPCAGLGTRFLPVTKVSPKELLPLVDKPCLMHVIEEVASAGVKKVILVDSPEKSDLRRFFSEDPQLENLLIERGHAHALDSLFKLREQLDIRFVTQTRPLGLGHAVLCAENEVGSDNFFVLLPDDIFVSEIPVTKQMRLVHQKDGVPLICVMPVQWDEVSRYGIVKASPLSDHVGIISDLVEKPKRDAAPSNLAVMGRYLLPPSIFAALRATRPGQGGEIQLTDALCSLISGTGLRSFAFEGERLDTGTPAGWLEANLILGSRHPVYKARLRELIKTLAASL